MKLETLKLQAHSTNLFIPDIRMSTLATLLHFNSKVRVYEAFDLPLYRVVIRISETFLDILFREHFRQSVVTIN